MKLHQSQSARTPSQHISLRELQAWRSALASCHGVSGLQVDLPESLLAVASTRPLHKHVISTQMQEKNLAPMAPTSVSLQTKATRIDALAWPFTPQSIDAVLLAWTPLTAARQPRVLTEMDLYLADDGRILLHIAPQYLAQWCRSGMAQAQALGWQLQQQHWGDRRRYSLMPAPLARYWVAPWQRYAPIAQWCVQLWQKTTCRPTPIRERSALSAAKWSGAWPIQQRHRSLINRSPLSRNSYD